LLVGVSLSGLELNAGKLPGKEATDYVYPDDGTMAYFASHGVNCIRLPILWERLQPDLNGALAASALSDLDRAVSDARAHDMRLIVDIHDYGRWRDKVVGRDIPASAFAGFWAALSKHINGLPGGDTVIFGLMNEPHDLDAASWRDAEQAAITAVRKTGARNLILASGADWDGAHSVVADGNAALLSDLHDPGHRMAIELHQYLDGDSSGTSPTCVGPAEAKARLQSATSWLRSRHLHGFLGEFGASATPACLASLDALLDTVDHQPDVWIGWTYWAAGPWWGNYMFSVQPRQGQDAPQMRVLARHMVVNP
jgi:endoglucanase